MPDGSFVHPGLLRDSWVAQPEALALAGAIMAASDRAHHTLPFWRRPWPCRSRSSLQLRSLKPLAYDERGGTLAIGESYGCGL
jgi:hypothetical protein